MEINKDNLDEVLKSCSKNEEAYSRLKELTDQLKQDREKAELRLNLLENAIQTDYDAILITTLDLDNPEIVYVNKGFIKMTGYSREEVIGKTPRILQGPKTDRAVLDKLKQRLKEGRAFFGHTVNYRKDGSEFINQWDIHPLTNEKGEITHWVSYQHDITERKRSELKLLDTEMEFDQLVEESKKILVDVDGEGSIVTSNKAFRDFLGYEAEELKQQNFGQLLVDKDNEDLKELLKTGDFENKIYNFEIINKQGDPIEVSAKARMLSGKKPLIRLALENKTIQKRIMQALSRRLSALDMAFDSPKDFQYKVEQSGETFIIRYISPFFEDITGISPDHVVELPFYELVHERDMEKVKDHLDIVLRGKAHTEQFRLKNKSGTYVKIIDYAKPEWGPDYKTVEAIKGTVSTEISSEKK